MNIIWKIWKNKVDNKYDVFVESRGDGYSGDLVIKDGDKELLRENVSISFGAGFGPDMEDVSIWEDRCVKFIDNLNK